LHSPNRRLSDSVFSKDLRMAGSELLARVATTKLRGIISIPKTAFNCQFEVLPSTTIIQIF
jgi:hypothetical protein